MIMELFYERYSRLVIFICGLILLYFSFIKKDVENPVVMAIIFILMLDSIYRLWQFYKQNNTIKLNDD